MPINTIARLKKPGRVDRAEHQDEDRAVMEANHFRVNPETGGIIHPPIDDIAHGLSSDPRLREALNRQYNGLGDELSFDMRLHEISDRALQITSLGLEYLFGTSPTGAVRAGKRSHHDQDARKNEIIDLLTSYGYTTFKEEGEKDKTNWYMILATADEDTESEEEEEDLLDHDGLKSIE